MNRSLLALAVLAFGSASATPFTGNDSRSNAMGNTGVASAPSFAAGQFNPALLAAYPDHVNFGLQLPTMKVAVDDSKGFIQHTNEYFIEGDVITNFQEVSFADIELAVFGDSSGTPSLSQVVSSASTNADELQTAIENEDYNQAEIEANELSADVDTLDFKVTTIQTELNDFNTAFDHAEKGVSGYRDRPLQILGSIGGAMAIPRSGLGLAVHLNTDAVIGMSTNIADSDLQKVSFAVDDLIGYTGEATDVTNLSNVLASETSELVTLLNNEPAGGPGDPEYDAWTNDVQNATDDVIRAQADLDAENSGSDQTVTLSDGSSTYTGTSDGNNINSYTSDNGYFVNGNFDDSQTEGLGDDSTINIVGANILEFGISVAREFEYMGETFSAGVTPKLQSITIFEDTIVLSNADTEAEEFQNDPAAYFNSNTTSVFTGNIDVGLAKNWPDTLRGNVRAGVVIKDLIPQTFESKSGTKLSIGPKMRIGAAHQTRWSTLSADLDITENQPLKYGVPTRYLGLGGEFNAWNWLKLRAGYRNNLSISDSHVFSTGFGITPFGVGLDLSGWFKPKSFDDWDQMIQDAGVVAQFSMEF